MLAGAQTGTGKTAAFVLPILQRLAGLGTGTTPIGGVNPDRRAPRALVLTPTRELAAQIAESARTYGKYAPVRTPGGLRWREHQSADQRPAQRLRSADRHTWPAARSARSRAP